MKKLIIGVLASILAIAAVGAAILWTRYTIGYNSSPVSVTFACKQHRTAHQVFIENNQLNIVHIDGHLCDTLTITNKDDRLRLMAFGKHDHHQAYDGVVEKVLAKDKSLTVTFDQPGSFLFHDHLEDEVQGTFTVTK